jgi:hypothetical protein
VIARDLNGDGNLDLVTANAGADSVSVLLGKGDGKFGPHTDFPTGAGPNSVAAGDLNGDGKLDLVTANFNSDNHRADQVSVLIGNGDGTFQPQVGYGATNSPTSVAIGDFNGDHKEDVLVTSGFAHQVSLLRGNGDGTLQPHVEYAVGPNTGAIGIALADFDGTGALGFANANFNDNSVSVYPSLPNVAVAPNQLNFGRQKVGTRSKARTVRLSNAGSTPLLISRIVVARDYAQTNNCPLAPKPLAVGRSCNFRVTFKPTKAGKLEGFLTIEDDASPHPQFVSMTGVGVAP